MFYALFCNIQIEINVFCTFLQFFFIFKFFFYFFFDVFIFLDYLDEDQVCLYQQ